MRVHPLSEQLDYDYDDCSYRWLHNSDVTDTRLLTLKSGESPSRLSGECQLTYGMFMSEKLATLVSRLEKIGCLLSILGFSFLMIISVIDYLFLFPGSSSVLSPITLTFLVIFMIGIICLAISVFMSFFSSKKSLFKGFLEFLPRVILELLFRK